MTALYNEIEPYAAAWLRNLSDAGHIAKGSVDARSIVELRPDEIRGFRQAHFFAGIGVWSHALRLAGWPDDRAVWTGSCPCQPFSVAGRRGGLTDERHLWPEWFRLIRECRPPVVFGEQVASPDGLAWLDAVSADLEGAGYAVGAADLCAAGVGAPHIRQRLYFVAHADAAGRRVVGSPRLSAERDASQRHDADGRGEPGRVEHADDESRREEDVRREEGSRPHLAGGVRGIWSDAIWIPCSDGKTRPIKPGIEPLAHEYPNRIPLLRASGNALVAELAAEFIRASIEAMNEVQQDR